jgi:hypothetical protein
MWVKILEQISKLILLPMLKDLALFVFNKYKEHQEKKAEEKRRNETIERSINEGDQRPIEDITESNTGEFSGRGVVVDGLPNIGMRDKKKD